MNPKRLKKTRLIFNSKSFKIFVFTLVLIFTFILRAHNYDRNPWIGHMEEMLFAWSGIYLIETGVPVSWSNLDYPKEALFFEGIKSLDGQEPKVGVQMYKPWLDEPPVFSLLVGSFAHLYQANRENIIPSSFVRIPMIFIATLISLFIFLILKKMAGFWIGLLGIIVYGVTPNFVLGSRMAVPENLITLFFIITLFLTIKFIEKDKIIYLTIIPLLAGIAGLAKPTGFLIILFPIYFLLKKKLIKLSFLMLFAMTPFVIAFFAYGIYYNSEIFWRITALQSFRPAGFSSLAKFFISPAYDINISFDSWYVFTLVASGYFLLAQKEKILKVISLAFVFWLAVILISGGEGDLLPWYRYPLFPILAIFGALAIQLILKNINLITSIIFTSFMLGNRWLLINAFHSNMYPNTFRLLFILLNLPAILMSFSTKKIFLYLSKIVIILVIAIGAYINTIYIYNQFEIQCEQKECPIGPSTAISRLYFPIFWRFFTFRDILPETIRVF